jgi:hypothetical protein
MTSQTDDPTDRGAPTPSVVAAGFEAYTAALEADGTPLLGHMVFYSVYEGRVTQTDLERWFLELGLDSAFLPPPIRPVDAFEQTTGSRALRLSYPLDGQRPLTAGGKRARRRTDGTACEATLMLRPVRRDRHQIVRNVVREVRDETRTRLSYSPHVAECIFTYDRSDAASPGAGTLQINPNYSAISKLSDDEQMTVQRVLAQLREHFERRCVYYSSDRLRHLLRTYVEHLGSTRLLRTGRVYFVHRAHASIVAALRELTDRMGSNSHLVRVPIPDQDEMREMIIKAFTTKARDDLDALSADIDTIRTSGGCDTAELQKLYRRFSQLKTATAHHAQLLSTTLDDTEAALKLVDLQLTTLLSTE